MNAFTRLKNVRLLAALLPALLVPFSLEADTTFNFTLARSGKTSAGVYNSSGKLVSTLWSDAYYDAGGAYSAVWDNKDDYGVTVPAGTYTIKVLAHNSNYVWEGVVGNTSDNLSGLSVHSCYRFTTAMAFTGTSAATTKGFYAVGYSENSAPFYAFNGATPQQVSQRVQGCTGGGNGYDWDYADADGSVVYFACQATQNQTTVTGPNVNAGAICAFNANGTIMSFSTGTTIKQTNKPFVNGIFVGTQPTVTGLAVQKGNTLLAASVAADNMVYLRDKVTGAAVGSFAVTTAGPLAFAPNGDLWVVSGTSVLKYTNVNAAPNAPTLSTTITGFLKPIALAVSPATAPQPNLLLVADGGAASQQIKAYDSTGTSQWTLGSAGGYSTDAAVTTNKFWFRSYGGSIAFQPDGSFWVVDYNNCRNLNYTLSSTAGALPTYQKQIAYVPGFYTASVDRNNPNRVFAATQGKWLEFAIDYSLPLGGTNGAWTLVKNWGYAVPALYKNFGLEGFRSVATLSNGRTYGIARTSGNEGSSIFELPASGNLRLTAVPYSQSVLLYGDGSLRTRILYNNALTLQKQALTGFAANGDPQFAATTTLASVPAVVGVDPTSGAARVHITPGNKLVFFDDSGNAGMHLGGINLGVSTSSWMWETAPGIQQGIYLWGDGSYETSPAVNYYGGVADVSGTNIVYLYKGENWQGGEASQLMHYHENGLFVGQFGTSGKGLSVDSPAGFAGNTVSGAMTVSGGNTYMYVSDESQHGGMHRWRLEGTGTIAELSGSGVLDSTVTLTGTAPTGTAPARTGVPAAPTYCNATPSNNKVNLEWAASANTTYYQIRRASSVSAGYQIIATSVFVPSYIDDDVASGVTYYYRVTAINSAGASDASAVTAAIPAPPPSNIYEAELGVLSGPTVGVDLTKASNGARINNAVGTVTINNINGNAGGIVPLTIRYAHNLTGNWTGHWMKINGVVVTLPALPNTGGWATYQDVTLNVTLNAGTANTLIFSKPPNIDKFTFGVSTSFAGTPWTIPAGSGTLMVEMENYNYGGEGAAFHDTAAATTSSVYRARDGVGVIAVPTVSNGHRVGTTVAGEWLEYTVSAPTTKAYTFTLYAGTSFSGKTLRVLDQAGTNLSGDMTITNTGSFNTIVPHTATINLVAGTNKLRIFLITGDYGLDYFTISH